MKNIQLDKYKKAKFENGYTKETYQCFICDSQFQMGLHEYNGKYINRYKINVCMICYDGNWDGWARTYETKLITHLKNENLPVPDKNQNGLLPRD